MVLLLSRTVPIESRAIDVSKGDLGSNGLHWDCGQNHLLGIWQTNLKSVGIFTFSFFTKLGLPGTTMIGIGYSLLLGSFFCFHLDIFFFFKF